jgi:hypothetical protein
MIGYSKIQRSAEKTSKITFDVSVVFVRVLFVQQ